MLFGFFFKNIYKKTRFFVKMYFFNFGNIDLSYCVAFNLANQLQTSGIYQEALAKYNEIIKSK